MLVLLSSMDVGDDGDTRWSNNDLQSVANIGDLRLSTDRAWKGLNGPSMASARRRLSHSTVPPAVAIAWASPPRVEFTARGSLYDLHTAGVHGESLPACMSSCTNAMIKPAWVWEPTFAQAASEWAHKVKFRGFDRLKHNWQVSVLSSSSDCIVSISEVFDTWIWKTLLGQTCLNWQIWSGLTGQPIQTTIYTSNFDLSIGKFLLTGNPFGNHSRAKRVGKLRLRHLDFKSLGILGVERTTKISWENSPLPIRKSAFKAIHSTLKQRAFTSDCSVIHMNSHDSLQAVLRIS